MKKNKNIFTISANLYQTQKNNENHNLIEYFKKSKNFYNKIFREVWQFLLEINEKEFKKEMSHINSALIFKYKISKRTADSIINDVITKFEAIKELKKYELLNLKNKIKKIKNDIKSLKSIINKNKNTVQSQLKLKIRVNKEYILKNQQLKLKLFQKQQLLNRKIQQLNNLIKEIENNKFSICFGSKKLFNAQYHLKENNLPSRRHWLEKFRKERDKNIFYVGRAAEKQGNQQFQITPIENTNNEYQIKVRNIDMSDTENKYFYGKIKIRYKFFNKYLKEILTNKIKLPISYRVVFKNNKISIKIMFEYKKLDNNFIYTSKFNGVVGLDYNDKFIQAAETDKNGNLINLKRIDLNYHGTGNKADNEIKQKISTIIKCCQKLGKSLIIEDLNFNKTKSSIFKKAKDKKYHKMIHDFDYSRYKSSIENCGFKNNVDIIKINPAYTSIIGDEKYNNRMKLNRHQGAAFVIARIGQGIKKEIKTQQKYLKF